MEIRSSLSFLFISLLFAVATAGCSLGPRLYQVTGTVKHQGEPIAKGQIQFEADNPGDVGVCPIENGKYSVKLTAGEKTVRISAPRETGKFTEGGMGAKIPELVDLPAKFNTASQEKRTVEANEPQTIDFDLQ
ncbi:hypothetical protein ETAA8_43190 [Anatilimnocola aggregata]|uniref:Carboxypeptidase regulatory-like domain-containing protein n=1 Tax=Anatilimnocola aggregata TaxID=2528021 RepID=A0A517YG98_9BACT|nr:hypothetical protein [Anatilimnocola aggregata]QDU29212.1 hypothetical protein ETAA8_43190 [Anatilimnocola aggregata]